MPSKTKNHKALINAKLAALKQQTRPKPIVLRTPVYYLNHASEYPIHGCWIDDQWKEVNLARIVVARLADANRVIAGIFLVDPLCLGVKNAWYRTNLTTGQITRFVSKVCGNPAPCTTDFAHHLIYGSIDYARRYGFEPHPDFNEASRLLEPQKSYPPNPEIQFGKDGKPFFISGPDDDVQQIMTMLRRTAGDGNFEFLAGFGDPGFDDFDDEPE